VTCQRLSYDAEIRLWQICSWFTNTTLDYLIDLCCCVLCGYLGFFCARIGYIFVKYWLVMIGLVQVVYAVLLQLVCVIKRMLCFLHITRSRKNSSNILPLHADVTMLSAGEMQSSLPSNDVRYTTCIQSHVFNCVDCCLKGL